MSIIAPDGKPSYVMNQGDEANFLVVLDPGAPDSFGAEFGLRFDPSVIQIDEKTLTTRITDPQLGDAYYTYLSRHTDPDTAKSLLTIAQWSQVTPGLISLGGVTLLGLPSGVPSTEFNRPTGAPVAIFHVRALRGGAANLVLTCPAMVRGVGDPANVSATKVFLPEIFGAPTLTVLSAAEATQTAAPMATQTAVAAATLQATVPPTPVPTPPTAGQVAIDDRNVNVGDVFTLNLTLTGLPANYLVRNASFGLAFDPPDVVRVTGNAGVQAGQAFKDFAHANGAIYGATPGFVVDGSGSVPSPGAFSLSGGRETYSGLSGGVLASVNLKALKAGSTRLRVLVVDLHNNQILDRLVLGTLRDHDTSNVHPVWPAVSGGHITVGNATSTPTPATATGTITPTVTGTAGTTPTTNASVTTTPGPTLVGGVQSALTLVPTSTPTPGRATSLSTLEFHPATSAAKAGDTFSVDVVLNADQEVRGVQFALAFNPQIVRVDRVDYGDCCPLFNQWANANGAGVTNLPPWDVDNGSGTISTGGLFLIGGPLNGPTGPSGRGGIARIFFKALVDGTSNLTLSDTKLGIQVGTASQSVSVTGTAGQIVVGAGAQATVAAITAATAASLPGQPGSSAGVGLTAGGIPAAVGGALPAQAPLVTFDETGQPRAVTPALNPEVAGVQSQGVGPAAPGYQPVAQGSLPTALGPSGPSAPSGPAGPASNVTRAPGVPLAGAGPLGVVAGGGIPAESAVRTPATASPESSGSVSPVTGPTATGPAAARAAVTSSPTPGSARGFQQVPTPVTFDIGRSVDSRGVVLEDIHVATADGTVRISLAAGTVALTADRRPLRTLDVTPVEDVPIVPDDVFIAGGGYEFGPGGSTFNPPITIVFPYDPSQIPEGIARDNVEPAFYDVNANAWVSLNGTVDPAQRTVTAQVPHFTTFAALTRHSGVNWALVIGVILVEIGLGSAALFVIPRWRRRRAHRKERRSGPSHRQRTPAAP